MQPSCVISSPTVVGGHFERIDRDEGMAETLEPCGGANYLNSEVIDSFNVTDSGANLVRHSERGGRVEDLNEAIIHLHEALPLAVSGYNRAVTLLNLANAISKRFSACGGLDDLEETTVYYREALDLLRRDRESNEARELAAMTLNSFASLLMARFQLFDRGSRRSCRIES
ncbi:hypothetical protein PHLCEN_2v134 [Hermanssonia centrifuga]|uniref:Uncharacterized protein n=1 Tax=Hermanssonia centrifuga TaxID=98765 RepID=A0A2R6S791_9APHY|nr:hypothetical protein PHLCEN_2v134 [Hermanssonia centrifuga]